MDLGYYDQSHFVHDFKAFTGLTPKKYEALLRADAYDQKLQILPANIPLYG
jgi:AraC-like DNA-binding protein